MTEEEVLETIEKIANKLCYKFKFGYPGVEDMQQQATLFALEGLDSYDEKRPLENFDNFVKNQDMMPKKFLEHPETGTFLLGKYFDIS